MGAGLGVALACDFRIASSDARFGAAHARLGYSGDYGVTWQLTQLLGPARAKAMMISAERFDAARALELGLVSRVVEPSALAEEAAGLAANLAAGPLVAHRHIKANVHAAAAESYADALEREATSNARCGVTDDHREGVAAFIEKREPRFKGR
jgi:2-(1,2-epoxy-1,2-dihydrophenyl)acetyl-CoA isomerase